MHTLAYITAIRVMQQINISNLFVASHCNMLQHAYDQREKYFSCCQKDTFVTKSCLNESHEVACYKPAGS